MKKLILSAILCWTMFSYGQDENRALSTSEIYSKGKFVISTIHYSNRVCVMFRNASVPTKIELFYFTTYDYLKFESILSQKYNNQGDAYEIPTNKNGILQIIFKCNDKDKLYPDMVWVDPKGQHPVQEISFKQVKKLLE